MRSKALVLGLMVSACTEPGDPPRETADTGGPPAALVDSTFRPIVGDVPMIYFVVEYSDQEALLTQSAAQTDAVDTAAYLERLSYGRMQVSIDVAPTITMPQPYSYYDRPEYIAYILEDVWKEAEALGYDREAYAFEVVFTKFPAPYGGIGMNNGRSVLSHIYNPKHASHELGHAFSFAHANYLPDNLASEEYGDPFDVMGGKWLLPDEAQDVVRGDEMNPWMKHRAGWLEDDRVLTVDTSATVAVDCLTAEDGPVALRIPRAGVASGIELPDVGLLGEGMFDVWVWHRCDEVLGEDGVFVGLGAHTNNLPSYLLDTTQGSLPEWGPARRCAATRRALRSGPVGPAPRGARRRG